MNCIVSINFDSIYDLFKSEKSHNFPIMESFKKLYDSKNKFSIEEIKIIRKITNLIIFDDELVKEYEDFIEKIILDLEFYL